MPCTDCNDDINNGVIPIGTQGPAGPQGIQGPVGPAPIITAVSGTAILLEEASLKAFTIAAGVAFIQGQRLIAANSDSTKVISGYVFSYIGTTLSLYIDSVTAGLGTIGSDWTISITGAKGNTGATGTTGTTGTTGAAGAAAYTTLTANTIPLGGNLYSAQVASSNWMIVGQVIFIKDAGYYQVTIVSDPTNITISNLEYPGNNAAALLSGKTVTASGLRGEAGANGTNGTNGFIYATTDGNTLAAQATDTYQLLMRNSTNTGYTFVSLSDLKILLASA